MEGLIEIVHRRLTARRHYEVCLLPNYTHAVRHASIRAFSGHAVTTAPSSPKRWTWFGTARHANRFEALEPLRQGVRRHFGGFAQGIAAGLAVRHDHGSQYMSNAFQKELRFLGIENSPTFVRTPEVNGCAERFIRTLKENLLWVRTFEPVEELRQALLEFSEAYNATWLIERHGFRPPDAAKRGRLSTAALAI